MTEAEWLEATEPSPMLELLGRTAADRKLRLFGVACCRLSWDSFLDAQLRHAVESIEELTDARLDETRRAEVERSLLDAYEQELAQDKEFTPTLIPRLLMLLSRSRYDNTEAVCCSACVAHWALGDDFDTNYRPFEAELIAEHTDIIREIFGNPLRPVSFSREWSTSTAVLLAKQIYESRDFSPMPILADALQDAGCDNDDILNHCRQPGEHVRGCWVVDLVLGKS